jgi:hypothetical protein
MRRNKEPLLIKVIYLNTRKNVKSTIERMIVNYNSQKNNGTKIGVPSLYGFESYKAIHYEGKEMITSTMSTFDQLSDKGILSAISARKSLYEIDNLIRSSMEEYGILMKRRFTYKEEHSNLSDNCNR